MNIIYLLLPLALILALFFVGLFLWANKRDQFDDLDSPAQKILLDDNSGSRAATKNDSAPASKGHPTGLPLER
jgi:cbb3-type cytochrome oxidase maturation protein